MRNKLQNRLHAFTLVELLVVTGIVAVLIGLLLPVLSRAREQANRTLCISNVRQLGMAVLMYCNENRGWFPTCAYPANGIANVQMPSDWIWWEANRNLDDSPVAQLLNVSGTRLVRLLRCPDDTFENHKVAGAISPGQAPYLYSYTMNDGLAQNTVSAVPAVFATRLTQWQTPAKKIMITEGMSVLKSMVSPPVCPSWNYVIPVTSRHGKGISSLDGGQIGTNVSAVFLDGHAQPIDGDVSNDPMQAQEDAE